MHHLQTILSSIGLFVFGAVLAADDCAIRMPLSNIAPELRRGCPEENAAMEKKARECIPIASSLPTNSYSIIEIRDPGHYCLTEDLHARIEFGDRPAEPALIVIRASDVILDLQGHTLGRGRIFKNPGGTGISIQDATNIHIRNGVLQDFGGAIGRGTRYPRTSDVQETPVYDSRTSTYHFPITNIVIENVTFKNNKTDIWVEIKKDLTP